MFNQPASEYGAHRRGDRRETGPCADRTAPLMLAKGSADDRKAPWNEKRCSDPLNAPGKNQLADIRSNAAPGRRSRKNKNANRKDPFAAVDVAQRSAHQQQRCKQERI